MKSLHHSFIIVVFAFLLAFSLSLAALARSSRIQSDLQRNIVRLHIIANSDCELDQNIKLLIRDRVVRNVKVGDSPELAAVEAAHIANSVLDEYAMPYTARAEYTLCDFPEKSYKNITLPAGRYNAVRVVLGDGLGQNWWCVLYPPVCLLDKNTAVIDSNSQRILEECLDEESYDFITRRSDGDIVVRFRSLELLGKFKELLKGKLA